MFEPNLAAAPTLDGWYFLTILSRVAHLACAGTLLGGLVYLRFVLAPSAPEGDREEALFAGRRGAWAMCVATCAGLLLLSGTFNLMETILAGVKLPPAYHMLFGVKFLLALGVMAIMSIVAGKTALAQKARGSLKPWLNIALVLCLGVFVLGAVVRSIRLAPAPPVTADEAPAFDADPIEIAE